jgi:hypothetical protein
MTPPINPIARVKTKIVGPSVPNVVLSVTPVGIASAKRVNMDILQ